MNLEKVKALFDLADITIDSINTPVGVNTCYVKVSQGTIKVLPMRDANESIIYLDWTETPVRKIFGLDYCRFIAVYDYQDAIRVLRQWHLALVEYLDYTKAVEHSIRDTLAGRCQSLNFGEIIGSKNLRDED